MSDVNSSSASILGSSRKNRTTRLLPRGGGSVKKVVGGQKRCNITWHYVAWMGKGGEWGWLLLFFLAGRSVS